MRNYVSSTFEKWYIAIYVMTLEKSHLTGPIRVVPELTPFLFLVKNSVFIIIEKEFLKNSDFGTHDLMTIFNKCSKFQNDLINILGDITS